MKKFILFSMAISVLSACSLVNKRDSAPQKVEIKDVSYNARKDDAGPRKRIVLLPVLDNASGSTSDRQTSSVRDKARVTLVKEINKSDSMYVIDASELDVDFSQLAKNGEYDLKSIAAKANEKGIYGLLEAKIMDIKLRRKGDEVGIVRSLKTEVQATVRLRMIAARSGNEIYNQTKMITATDDNTRVGDQADASQGNSSLSETIDTLVEEAFAAMVPKLAETMAQNQWEGRIALVQGERVFLNVGRLSGLQLGDILKVSDTGDEVYDPETGILIGKVPGRLKGTLEVISYFGQDGAIAVVHSGAGFKENDRVEMY